MVNNKSFNRSTMLGKGIKNLFMFIKNNEYNTIKKEVQEKFTSCNIESKVAHKK